jgi:1-aminocyclopropane-1-carboxylate deaminase/D-cysteine desulfhydrase-like pyridoxal-dependent ACC family enzyme
MALGLALCGIAAPVIGYCVSGSAAEQRGKVSALIEQTCAKLDITSPLQVEDLVFEEGVLGPGYGQPTAAMREAVSMVAALEGLMFDPVYTGKAMAGLVEAIKSGGFGRADRVVFIHTGGAPSLFAYPDVFGDPIG